MIKLNFTSYKGVSTIEFQLTWVIWSIMAIWEPQHWEGYVNKDSLKKLENENPETFKMTKQELMGIIHDLRRNKKLEGTITKLIRITAFRKELIRRLPQNDIKRWYEVPSRTTNLSELAFENVKELFGLFDWTKLKPIILDYVSRQEIEIEAGQLPNLIYRDINAARSMQQPCAMRRHLSDKIANIEALVSTPSPIRDFDDLKRINDTIKFICIPIKQ